MQCARLCGNFPAQRVQSEARREESMQRSIACASAVALALSGCAAPNTPGAGIGRTYTPVVDMAGVDGNRYSRDLDECRRLAEQVNEGREGMQGLIVGALVGAAIGSAYGVNRRGMDGVVTSGMLAGSGAAGRKASTRQEAILGNCLAGRGYRVLDGTATVAVMQPMMMQPTPAPVAPAPTVAPGVPVAAAAMVPVAVPSAQPALPAAATVQAPKEVLVAKAAPPQGQFGFEAGKTARELRCAAFDTPAVFVAKGAGYESYSVACVNGDTMMIRCEFGTCRALR